MSLIRPYHQLTGDEARCNHCGGVSVFKAYTFRSGKKLRFWGWWHRFKRAHAHPELDLNGPWFR